MKTLPRKVVIRDIPQLIITVVVEQKKRKNGFKFSNDKLRVELESVKKRKIT